MINIFDILHYFTIASGASKLSKDYFSKFIHFGKRKNDMVTLTHKKSYRYEISKDHRSPFAIF